MEEKRQERKHQGSVFWGTDFSSVAEEPTLTSNPSIPIPIASGVAGVEL